MATLVNYPLERQAMNSDVFLMDTEEVTDFFIGKSMLISVFFG